MSEATVTKKITGYKRKLSRVQIIEAAQMAVKGAFYPDIARHFDITICECVGLLNDEQVGKKNIRYKIYGNKTYSYTSADTKAKLAKLIDEGWDDDEIAQLWHSNVTYIQRLRSHYGLVAFNRIVGKGHTSPREVKHGVEIDINTGSWIKPEAVRNYIDSIVEPQQGKLFENHDPSKAIGKVESVEEKTDQLKLKFNELSGEMTELNNNGLERSIVKSGNDYLIMKPHKTKVQIGNQPYKMNTENLLVVIHDSEKLQPGIAKAIVDKITWKEVALRIQNPNVYYVIKGIKATYHFKQIAADTMNNVVEVRLVNSISVSNQEKL
jgi:hypothetical protein